MPTNITDCLAAPVPQDEGQHNCCPNCDVANVEHQRHCIHAPGGPAETWHVEIASIARETRDLADLAAWLNDHYDPAEDMDVTTGDYLVNSTWLRDLGFSADHFAVCAPRTVQDFYTVLLDLLNYSPSAAIERELRSIEPLAWNDDEVLARRGEHTHEDEYEVVSWDSFLDELKDKLVSYLDPSNHSSDAAFVRAMEMPGVERLVALVREQRGG